MKILLIILIFLLSPVVEHEAPYGTPTDVENLMGDVLDGGAVSLSWDAANDDELVSGYKVYYDTVSIEDMAYDEYYENELLTESEDPHYTVSTLERDVPYYFSVTAIDNEENESYHYSNEVELVILGL